MIRFVNVEIPIKHVKHISLVNTNWSHLLKYRIEIVFDNFQTCDQCCIHIHIWWYAPKKIEQVHHVQILIDVSRCVHLMYYYYHSHNITTLQCFNKLGCYILNERFSSFSCYEDKHRKFSPPQGIIIFCTQTREDFFWNFSCGPSKD